MSSKTVAIHTMGCKANQYDSAAIEGDLSQAGWKLVPFNSEADAYILNTCTVTNKADSEARQLVRKVHRLNPDASIVVTGCYAQTDPESLAEVEGVSFILGNNQKSSILDYLNQVKPLVPEIIVEDLFKEEVVFSSDFTSYSKNTRAFLKIQDGCNQFCSFCVIPYARGKNRSLEPDKILSELRKLKEQKFEEVVLTGIHLGTYGYDLDPKNSLLDLMRRIEEESPVHRVRLSSIDPEEVTDEMIDFLAQSKVFCEYLHIPIQSGEDETLKLMRRRYKSEEFTQLSFRLKDKIPEICIGTDVMVGFPFETEERFEKSCQLIEEAPIDYLHVFPYSAKKGTKAATFKEQISSSVKKERVARLLELSRKKKEKFYLNSIGKKTEIILEENSNEKDSAYLRGVSRNYLFVNIPSKDCIHQKSVVSPLIFGRPTHYEKGELFGEIIET